MLLYLYFLVSTLFAKDLVIIQGEQKTIVAKGPLWIEQRKFLEAEDRGHIFILKGKQSGLTEVKNGTDNFFVQVLHPLQERTWQQFQDIQKKTLNIKAELSQGKIYLRGRLYHEQDLQYFINHCEQKNCRYILAIQMSPAQQSKLQKQINNKLKSLGLPDVKLDFSKIVSVRIASNNPHKNELSEQLQKYGINIIIDDTSVTNQPLVKVQITVAEIKKEESLKYGIEWPATYSAQLLPALTGGNEQQFLNLQFLEKNGVGKILASPTLLCRSGKSAEFLAGGEFPIPVLGYRSKEVIWKKYGILLKIKPIADNSGKMSIELETEVSSIDTANSVGGVPGLYTNRIQSHFDLNETKTIALSGLIKSEEGTASSGLPGLSRLPILGALFASKEFRESRTELVIFVKPEVIGQEYL